MGMGNTFVVGCYWGDEGKGKIIDALASGRYGVFYATVRATGGNNAGHTIIIGSEHFITHLVPSGIVNPEMVAIIGNGMVIDLEGLVAEINDLKKRGINPDSRLFISNRAHAVMPYNIVMDRGSETSKEIGTTGRGIGQTYTDKMAREGIRLSAFFHPPLLEDLVSKNLERKRILNKEIKKMDAGKIVARQLELFGVIRQYVIGTSLILDKIREKGKPILFEGAQGTMLSIDHGTYPKVTSSDSCAGGICTGAGFGPAYMHRGIGVAKAYPTRVGNGSFPTEMGGTRSEEHCGKEGGQKYTKDVEAGMHDIQRLLGSGDEFNLGIALRMKGGEYGATTGRPRRCGWPDLFVLRYAKRVNSLTEIALTKLDVLGGIANIKVCTEYELNGAALEDIPAEEIEMRAVKPVYITMPGWEGDISAAKKFGDLPVEAKDLVRLYEDTLKLHVTMIGVGPERDQLIVRE